MGVNPVVARLAERSHSDAEYLRSVVTREADPYVTRLIPKRSGGIRRLDVPDARIRAFSTWFLREHLERGTVHDTTFAFVKGRSALAASREHLDANTVVRLDLRTFFDSITERSVYFVVRDLGFEQFEAFCIARLLTRASSPDIPFLPGKYAPQTDHGRFGPPYFHPHLGFLPQGLPSSGMVANLAFTGFDYQLRMLAARAGFRYTRYADDLIFSSPSSIARESCVGLIREVDAITRSGGFRLNKKKTTISGRGSRRLVLGVDVSGPSTRVRSGMRQRIERHLWAIARHGLLSHSEHEGFGDAQGMVHHVSGLIEYIVGVEPPYGWTLRRRLWNLLEPHEELRRYIPSGLDDLPQHAGQAGDERPPESDAGTVVSRTTSRNSVADNWGRVDRPWDHREDAELIRRYDEGQAIPGIAAAMAIDQLQIARRLIRLTLDPRGELEDVPNAAHHGRRYAAGERAEILTRFDAGLTLPVIAGLSKRTQLAVGWQIIERRHPEIPTLARNRIRRGLVGLSAEHLLLQGVG